MNDAVRASRTVRPIIHLRHRQTDAAIREFVLCVDFFGRRLICIKMARAIADAERRTIIERSECKLRREFI